MNYSTYFDRKSQVLTIPGIGRVPFKVYHLGELILPTGQLVACDPLSCLSIDPFPLKIEPGIYNTCVSVATVLYGNEILELVAFSQVISRHRQPIKWEPIASISKSGKVIYDAYCYTVAASTGSYMDNLAVEILDDDDRDYEKSYIYEITEEIELFSQKKLTQSEWRSANVCVDPSSGANVIAFIPGWGNGDYLSYAGYDEMSNLVSLVTDFGIFFDGVCSPYGSVSDE